MERITNNAAVETAPATITDKYWQIYVFWSESVPDIRQNAIKYRKKNVHGQWEPAREINLGPSMKAVEPTVSAKGRTLVLVFRGIDRALPGDTWDIRCEEIPNFFPA